MSNLYKEEYINVVKRCALRAETQLASFPGSNAGEENSNFHIRVKFE